jgi:hypothetical protein
MTSFDFPIIQTVFGALLAFWLGLFWYHPKVMGRKWLEARKTELIAPSLSVPALTVNALLWLLASIFYAFMVKFYQIDTPAAYLCLSSLLWVAFAMPPTVMGSLYTNYPFQAVAVDSSYQLAGYYMFAIAHISMMAK